MLQSVQGMYQKILLDNASLGLLLTWMATPAAPSCPSAPWAVSMVRLKGEASINSWPEEPRSTPASTSRCRSSTLQQRDGVAI